MLSGSMRPEQIMSLVTNHQLRSYIPVITAHYNFLHRWLYLHCFPAKEKYLQLFFLSSFCRYTHYWSRVLFSDEFEGAGSCSSFRQWNSHADASRAPSGLIFIFVVQSFANKSKGTLSFLFSILPARMWAFKKRTLFGGLLIKALHTRLCVIHL